MSVTRRELFGFLRREAENEREAEKKDEAPETEPADGGFSLDAFYARRGAGAEASTALPVFAVRADAAGAAGVTDTRVGIGPLAAADGAAAAEIAPLPAGMVPVVIPARCLAPRSFCATCVERCQAPGALVMDGALPRVVEAACTGCGLCVAVCPAPIMAFELVARSPSRG